MSHTSLVVIKSFAEVSAHIEAIGRLWRFSHLDLDEARYMYDWNTTTRQFLKVSLDDLSLALPDGQQGEHVFARNEWKYIDRYLTNITSASGRGELYNLPSDLPFIGNLQFRYTGVKYLSTLMIRIRLFHISHLILRPSDTDITSSTSRGDLVAVMERYAQAEVGSDLSEKIYSVFDAIKHGHHALQHHEEIQEQTDLESEVIQLELHFVAKAAGHRSIDYSEEMIKHFEEIIRQNEDHAAYLANMRSANFRHSAHQVSPPSPIPYLGLLGRLLHEHSQHLAQHAVHPRAHAQQSLAHGASSQLTHRQRAIYDKV
ncbi:hypothetical protein JCM5353_001007 [Sporobolomyces roseus]